MKIKRVSPPAPPPAIEMSFPRDEGWAIVAALREYAVAHPDAVHAGDWHEWADEVDRQLRA